MDNIPILILCFNNYKYVDNTIKQILAINTNYGKNIKIVNNSSTCADTIEYLNKISKNYWVYNSINTGPWITPNNHADIYHEMPAKYIVTDPDLQFNDNLPHNFIDIMSELSDKYQAGRLGLALDITDFNEMFEFLYTYDSDNKWHNIYEWEKRYWNNRIDDDQYELYYAPIDTTFAILNKNFSFERHIRIAGDFTAKHLPWYKNNKIYTVKDVVTTSNIAFGTMYNMMRNNYLHVFKRDVSFVVKKDINLSFWTDAYPGWRNLEFDLFDNLLDSNKVFIDIGAWIGPISLYALFKSKHIVCVEADKDAYNDLCENLKLNSNNINDYTVIQKALFNRNDIHVLFGKNRFINGSRLNDSTSHIYMNNYINDECYLVKTITIHEILRSYNINSNDVSMIRIDIEGGEEFILNDLIDINKKYEIPVYINFHYDWWVNKDLNRFPFLNIEQKQQIISNPFTSILFK